MNKAGELAKKLGGVISENSPTILTGLAVGGLFTTVIFAVRATPKAVEILEGEGYYAGYIGKKEAVKLTWKLYIPAVAMGTATIACIIGSNSVNTRRNAALASAYGMTQTAFREYKDKVIETIGKNKELKVRDEIAADQVKNNPPGGKEVIFTGKGEVMCYDSLSGRYFKSDIEAIRRTINDLNRDLLSEMFINLNELYDAIGLSGTKLGDQLGWDIDRGLIDVSFSTQLTEDGEPCIVLNYEVQPRFYDEGH